MRPYSGPPATLATTLAAGLDLWGDCLRLPAACAHQDWQLEALADRYGRDTPIPDRISRLVCTECGGKLDVRVHVPGLAKFGGRRDQEEEG